MIAALIFWGAGGLLAAVSSRSPRSRWRAGRLAGGLAPVGLMAAGFAVAPPWGRFVLGAAAAAAIILEIVNLFPRCEECSPRRPGAEGG